MKKNVLLILTLLLFLFLPAEQTLAVNLIDEKIERTGQWKILFSLENGSKDNQLGFLSSEFESGLGGSYGVSSFRIYNDNFYLLDNIKQRIVVVSNGDIIGTVELPEYWYEDFLVLNDGFLLLTGEEVLETNMKGEIIELIDVPGQIANKFEFQTADELYLNTDIGTKPISSPELIPNFQQMDHQLYYKDGDNIEISLNKSNNEFPVRFKYGEGSMDILSFNSDSLLLSKTEISDTTSRIITETQVELWGKNGIAASLRVPTEKMQAIPNVMVQTSNNIVYLLLISDTHTSIYQGVLGTEYESLLDDRIQEEIKKEIINIPIDNNIRPLDTGGTNSWIHRYTANQRVNAMINFSWLLTTNNKNMRCSYATLPSQVRNNVAGTRLTGIPYCWGGKNGADKGIIGEKTFGHWQQYGLQTGNISSSYCTNSTGVDCVDFVQLSWNYTKDDLYTGNLRNICNVISRKNVKYMDALNSSSQGHAMLYYESNGSTFYTREATVAGNQEKAKTYVRTATFLDNNGYSTLRYTQMRENP